MQHLLLTTATDPHPLPHGKPHWGSVCNIVLIMILVSICACSASLKYLTNDIRSWEGGWVVWKEWPRSSLLRSCLSFLSQSPDLGWEGQRRGRKEGLCCLNKHLSGETRNSCLVSVCACVCFLLSSVALWWLLGCQQSCWPQVQVFPAAIPHCVWNAQAGVSVIVHSRGKCLAWWTHAECSLLLSRSLCSVKNTKTNSCLEKTQCLLYNSDAELWEKQFIDSPQYSSFCPR